MVVHSNMTGGTMRRDAEEQMEAAVLTMRIVYMTNTSSGNGRSRSSGRAVRVSRFPYLESDGGGDFNFAYEITKTKVMNRYGFTDEETARMILECLRIFNKYGSRTKCQDVPVIAAEIVSSLLDKGADIADCVDVADKLIDLIENQSDVIGERRSKSVFALGSRTPSYGISPLDPGESESTIELVPRDPSAEASQQQSEDDPSREMDIPVPVYEDISPPSSPFCSSEPLGPQVHEVSVPTAEVIVALN